MCDSFEPDHELLVWEKWIQIRKEETDKLSRKTMRPSVDLTMNLLEKIRAEKERKIVLEYAQIDEKPTVRGGLWEQPLQLKQVCYCKPIYEVQRTAAEKGKPEVVEHVGVPDYIKETEMGIIGQAERKPFHKLNADYEKYRKRREVELQTNIKKIDPYRPHLGQLLVRGGKPKPPVKNLLLLPNIILTQEVVSELDLTTTYAIRINNTIIYKDIAGQNSTFLETMKKESWHENCTSWAYYFKVPIKKVGRSKLYLKNLGTVTLRYCWKKLKRSIPFIPEDIYEQVFFFNKNEDVISPGQSKVIFFTFVSDKPGIFSEFWELSFCNICFLDTLAHKIVINLYADSIENNLSILKKVDVLKSKIENKAVLNTIQNMIEKIVNEATNKKPEIYPYKKYLLEAEIFLMKNPVCYYHETEVMKMKETYTEMAPGKKWDMSITSWRKTMMDKEFEERMQYFELLRKSHSELLKPWYEGESVLNQKYRAMKWLLGLLADNIDREYDRILNITGVTLLSEKSQIIQSTIDFDLNPRKISTVRNLFYIYTYEQVTRTIDMFAGLLSSIDSNRWVKFDFCRF